MIAERLLHLAKDSDSPREPIRVAISAPYDLSTAERTKLGIASACEVYTGPIGGESTRVYGVDKVQALSIAIAEIDMFLVGLAQQGALFWESGEPYDPELAAPLPTDLSDAIRAVFRK